MEPGVSYLVILEILEIERSEIETQRVANYHPPHRIAAVRGVVTAERWRSGFRTCALGRLRL